MNKVFQQIADCGLVSILRGIEQPVKTVEALYAGGVTAVEITLNTPGALEMIQQVRRAFGDRMMVGAGTVLDAATARAAILAGADFVLSPTLDLEVIRTCLTYGKLPVPGVFTPTEMLSAWQAGAPILKVFPAGAVGPRYIKDIKGPLGQLQLMPVGGVTLENAAEFIRCGSLALGVGGELANAKLANAGDYQAITGRAKAFVQAVAQGRAAG